MSEKTHRRGDSGGNGSRIGARPLQLPLRRSPRLLSQANGEDSRAAPPTSTEKPKTPSKDKTLTLGSPPWSAPRRSTRLASISRDIEEMATEEKTQRGFSRRSPKKGLRSVETLRRPPRFASVSVQVSKKSIETPKGTTEKGAPFQGSEVKERRRSLRLMGAKVSENVEVGTEMVSDANRGKGESPLVSKRREGGEEKRRKIGEHCEEKIGIGERGGRGVEECCSSEEWTKEQEAALQRAYLVAKPSPHFWKKVSKRVPGKSAQECFDRIHVNFATPSQPQPRSRTKGQEISPIGTFSLSGSRSPQPIQSRVKRLRNHRNNSLAAQKTVRHLLRKHCLIDQSQEADHFSVLETSPSALVMGLPEMTAPTTPDCVLNPAFLQKCNERSSSAHPKMLSRFKALNQANHPSPEVLKRIKNMALHEKYINQLHCREARRTHTKTGSIFAARDTKNIKPESRFGVLKNARTALMSEAREAIFQFQHIQVNSLGTNDIDDDGDDGSYLHDDASDDE